MRDAGLTNESGWIPVDRATLRTRSENVYATGDVTSIPIPGRWKPDVPLMLPKAGVFAHAQGLAVARRIAAEVIRAPAKAEFDGSGYCMLEAGETMAGFAFGDFFATPAPEVHLRHGTRVALGQGAPGAVVAHAAGPKARGSAPGHQPGVQVIGRSNHRVRTAIAASSGVAASGSSKASMTVMSQEPLMPWVEWDEFRSEKEKLRYGVEMSHCLIV